MCKLAEDSELAAEEIDGLINEFFQFVWLGNSRMDVGFRKGIRRVAGWDISRAVSCWTSHDAVTIRGL